MITDKFKYILMRMLLVVCASCIALTGCNNDDKDNDPGVETENNVDDTKNEEVSGETEENKEPPLLMQNRQKQ